MSLSLAMRYASQAKDKGLIDLQAPSVDSRITFTRASSRTYFDAAGVLQTASTDVWPREFDLATGACLGRSVWAAATNLSLYSADLTNAAWTKTTGTAAKDQTGLDGSANTASSFTATSGNATVLQTVAGASAARMYSVYLKRITGTGTVEITHDGGATWTTCVLTSAWQRFTKSQTVTNPQFGVRVVTNGDAVAIDGNQLETGSIATPYIPTTSATVTRAVEVATVLTLSSIGFNASEGTTIAEAMTTTSSNTREIFAYTDNTNNNTIENYMASGAMLPRMFMKASGSGSVNSSSGVTITASTFFRSAFAYKANDCAISVNGAAAVTDATATVPTVDRLHIGSYRSNTFQINGYIKRILYIPRRLTDAELAKASKL